MNAATRMWMMAITMSWIGLAVDIERAENVHWTQIVGFAVGIDQEIFHARG